tara:strand:- start:718 stop:1059 length:342 start_codon:yes stop_codon:yes gene_type:complete
MSTNYMPIKPISYKQMKAKCKDIDILKDENSCNKWGTIIHQNSNYLHFYDYQGKVESFTRFGGNNVENIISHIQFKMGVPIYDEYSEEYEQIFLQGLSEEERKEFLKETRECD